MANRIKQLAEQAWIDTEETFGSFVDEIGEINYTFLHAYDQEFAQLIILDCLEICKQREQANLYGVKEALATIMEHFEVEL